MPGLVVMVATPPRLVRVSMVAAVVAGRPLGPQLGRQVAAGVLVVVVVVEILPTSGLAVHRWTPLATGVMAVQDLLLVAAHVSLAAVAVPAELVPRVTARRSPVEQVGQVRHSTSPEHLCITVPAAAAVSTAIRPPFPLVRQALAV